MSDFQESQQALVGMVAANVANRALVDGFPSYVQAGANAASALQTFLNGMISDAQAIQSWGNNPSGSMTVSIVHIARKQWKIVLMVRPWQNAPPIIQAYVATGTTVYTSACSVFNSVSRPQAMHVYKMIHNWALSCSGVLPPGTGSNRRFKMTCHPATCDAMSSSFAASIYSREL